MISPVDAIGILGSCTLAACAIPQLVKTVRTKSADDFDWSFLWMWLAGDVLMLAYSVAVSNGILTANYAANLVPICVILYYKLIDK